MINSACIFIGAGLGGILRYWISYGLACLLGRYFPFGTLFVNVTGSFLMGFLFILLLNSFHDIAQELKALLLIGFLGGYTTFSSFSLETLALFENGQWFGGLLNILLNMTLCIFLAWIGMITARLL